MRYGILNLKMGNHKNVNGKKYMLSLLPLLTFIIIYLGISIVMGDFYKVPITVAFLISAMVSVVTLRDRPLPKRIRAFSKGASSEKIMLMIWIFVLAGAFASSAKTMGSIDNTVNLALQLLPANMIMSGLFLAACFVSLSVGTSVGTVVALVPIATGLANATDINVAMMVGIVVGGALFGDNLSFISDTTVVATQTQGCKMSDKFHANLSIVSPAAICIFILYIFLGKDMHLPQVSHETEFIKVLPYVTVLITAAMGMNVILVLSLGLVLTGTIGVYTGAYDIFGFMHSMHEGILGMSELIIVTVLAGGMLEVVRMNGGINIIISSITRHAKGRRGGEAAIALIVMLVDFCTANNTIAIITVGPIAKQISEQFGIEAKRTASLLDTFSCFAQGIIPYGAQLLMAGGLAAITPASIIPYLFYPYALGLVAIVSIAMHKQSSNK